MRTARAKGLHEPRVIGLHAMRNAVLPLITVLGLEVAGLVNGSLIVETVFSWPGVGKVLTGSVSRRDFPILQFGVVSYACVAVDLAFGPDGSSDRLGVQSTTGWKIENGEQPVSFLR